MAPKPARKVVDWAALRPHYEAGIIPLKKLGETFGCSDAAIIKHAAKQAPPWERNLKGRIQAAADAKVAANVVSGEVSETRAAQTKAVIEGNATLQANARLAHRAGVKKLFELSLKMLDELDQLSGEDRALCEQLSKVDMTAAGKPVPKQTQDKLRDAIARAAALPTRVSINKNLTEAMRVQVLLERLALGIDDRGGAGPEDVEFTEILLNARKRAAGK